MQLTELLNCDTVSLPLRPCFFGFSILSVTVCDYLLLQIFKLFLANDSHRPFVLSCPDVWFIGVIFPPSVA